MCKKNLYFLILLGLLALGMRTSPGFAEEVQTTRLLLHPTAAPIPALKYRFLPTYFECKPGNAATSYQRAIVWYLSSVNSVERDRREERCLDWLEGPIENIPLEEARKLVSPTLFEMLEQAVHMDRCEWELPLREENLYSMQLPHLSSMRTFLRLQQLQTRCYMAEGKLDEAMYQIRNEFAMARHAAEPPVLICGLVGIAMANVACQDIELAIQQPDCPNLYWSLVQIPRPFIDLQKSFETEAGLLYSILPTQEELENPSIGPDYWRGKLNECIGTLGQFGAMAHEANLTPLVSTAAVLAMYPKAKKSLIEDWGHEPERIEAMATAQVVMLHTVKTYNAIRDELFKPLSLPSLEDMQKEAAKFNWDEWRKKESIPLASMLLPAVTAAKAAETNLTQKIDLLRLIEAIRLYAYHHDGQLPEQLDQITEVPIPLDPTTGRPFSYRREGELGIIEYVIPYRSEGLQRVEIQMVK